MNVIVTGGGTGGHFYPALMFYNQYKETGDTLLYIGSDYGIEKNKSKEYDLNYKLIKSRGFIGKNIYTKVKSIIYNLYALICCIIIFIKFKPDLIIATGGYVSFPVLFTAVLLKKKFILQEQNSYPGIVTRIFASRADKIYAMFPEIHKYLKVDKNKIIEKLTPVRKEFFGKYEVKKNQIIIVGGSQGSIKINNVIEDMLKKYDLSEYYIIWITGKKNYDTYKYLVKDNIKILDYTEEIYKLLGESEIVISRSGATSIAEFIVLNKKVIFIPFALATHNHQLYNAKSFCEKYRGIIIEEKDLTSELLLESIQKLIKDKSV